MAVSKGQYDPVKAIEGMFNGSVTRIAQALKDPADYSGNTKTVLAECAKRFHDALDDCEIQLLDAKWYLEHQLRSNQARRETKAREMGMTAKRKHDEIKDTAEPSSDEQNKPKRPKVEPVAEQDNSKDQPATIEPAAEQKSHPNKLSEPVKKPQQPEHVKMQTEEKIEDNLTIQKTQPTQSVQPTEAPQSQSKPDAPPPPDDFAKPTPQATPTGTNDEFNFESMFGEPTNDTGGDNNNKDLDDLEFDFTTGDFNTDAMANSTENQDPPSLDMLLPGLESYAKQTDDNNMMVNANSTANTNVMNNTNNSNNQDSNALPSFSNEFDLPNLGGPNIFDDFLNDDGLGGMDGGGGNFEDGIDLNDSALLDLDFDSFQ